MYCNVSKQSENVCSRIFRPWDSTSQDISQDNTVSTTTQEEENHIEVVDLEEPTKTSEEYSTVKHAFKQVKQTPMKIKNEISHLPVPITYHMEPYMFPEVPNLTQSLRIPSNDSFFMETMVQGMAFEEYARVLNEEHQAKILASRKQRPKKYKCPHCNVGFSNNGQLKGHIRIHTGERPFKCDDKECGKTFTRNEELTRHKRIHSGLRPFPCTHCGKRFGRKDHLKKHSRTHFQSRGMYAVPVMMPLEAWAASPNSFPFVPMFGY